MRSVLPIIIFSVVISLITFGTRVLLRRSNNSIWKITFIDKAGFYWPYIALLLLALVIVTVRLKLTVMTTVTMSVLSASIIISLILLATLPFSLLADYLARQLKKSQRKVNPESVDEQRRLFLKTAAAVMPVALITSTGTGFAGGFSQVRVPVIDMAIDDLPAVLQNLRILHLSDLHLGYYFQLNDLEELLLRIESHELDLVMITGDLSDDLGQLKGALDLINQLPAQYGKFISIGNHEYYRGVREFIRGVEASTIPLLLNVGHTIEINQQKVYIAGTDDPMHLRGDISEFMLDTTMKSMQDAPSDAFKVLMSHRAKALDFADRFNVDLILAGHTHGGQIGFNRRSVFENFLANEPYLWGKYKKGKTQLYTSSGVGHWFPFRIGCPAEAPIIVLKNRI